MMKSSIRSSPLASKNEVKTYPLLRHQLILAEFRTTATGIVMSVERKMIQRR